MSAHRSHQLKSIFGIKPRENLIPKSDYIGTDRGSQEVCLLSTHKKEEIAVLYPVEQIYFEGCLPGMCRPYHSLKRSAKVDIALDM